MDVFRRIRALRRRPEKVLEDSLSADCGALHLHHPSFYGALTKEQILVGGGGGGSGTNGRLVLNASAVNLLSYEDLDLGLFRSATPSSTSAASSGESAQQQQQSNVPRFRVVKGVGVAVSVPKSVRAASSVVPASLTDIKMNLRRRGGNAPNEVFRSNSFKFEKGAVMPNESSNGANASSVSHSPSLSSASILAAAAEERARARMMRKVGHWMSQRAMSNLNTRSLVA